MVVAGAPHPNYDWLGVEQGETENEPMAIAGSATAAYRCQVNEYRLAATPTTALRSECANVSAAVEILSRGEACTVAGFDMAQLQQRLAGQGVA